MKAIRLKIIMLVFCALPFIGGAQNNWLPVGAGLSWAGGIRDMCVDTVNDLLYIAGRVSYAEDTVCSPGIFSWNGSHFQALGCGIDWNCQGLYQSAGPYVFCVTMYNNELYAGGSFSSASGVPCNDIARWNGTSWDSVSSGLNNAPMGMRVINGEMYVVGGFTVAGGIPVNGIAKWNGTTWSDVHNFPNYGSNLLSDVIEYNNDLYVCGNFSGANGCHEIVKWDGSNWVNVGGGLFGSLSAVEKMSVYQNKLFIGGLFSKAFDINNPGNYVAAWDGSSWIDPAGGMFNPNLPTENGQIHDLEVYHNELYAAGALRHAGGVPGSYIAKWDGVQWCTFDTIGALDNLPYSLAVYHDSLFVGGGFWVVNGDSLYNLMKWGGGNYVDTCGQFYLGITDPVVSESLVTVFPNPATTNVTFQINGNHQMIDFIIYDQFGREVWRKQSDEDKVELSTEGFESGMYFYRIEGNREVKASGKLIIE